jgi:hypothetical protein
MLAAEHASLPSELQAEIEHYSEIHLAWLRKTVATCRREMRPTTIQGLALAMFALTTGAQLAAHLKGGVTDFDDAIEALLDDGLFQPSRSRAALAGSGD